MFQNVADHQRFDPVKVLDPSLPPVTGNLKSPPVGYTWRVGRHIAIRFLTAINESAPTTTGRLIITVRKNSIPIHTETHTLSVENNSTNEFGIILPETVTLTPNEQLTIVTSWNRSTPVGSQDGFLQLREYSVYGQVKQLRG